MQKLSLPDVIALGFMTFALFLGAGNIIFPPMVGQAAGEHFWLAAIGFLLTGVGLPLLTIVALARVGGGMDILTAPIGRVAGTLLGVLVYLTIGPLVATPRTATVSFEVGFAPFVADHPSSLFIYTVVYFSLALLVSLFPGKLIDNVGKYITPALIVSLAVLAAAALLWPIGGAMHSAGLYQSAPLSQGFVQGYQTMDALGALVFGIVIVNAIRDRRVSDAGLQTRYAIIAALIAATGLALVYLSFIYLGATSGSIAPHAQTGVPILTGFVLQTFGTAGELLLAVVITLACFTTAVGLISACGEYFSRLLPVSYRTVVIALSLVSLVVANQGLAQLIAVSGPLLVGIYPVAISLVALSLLSALWRSPTRVFVPVMLVAVVMGLADAVRVAGVQALAPVWLDALPGASLGMGWTAPVVVALLIAGAADRVCARPRSA
ncbi:branched-chain amino acid transport system II carrier protein [Alcaligenaceae bacterium]|nr:branched-chain amino acid transport system II carrier protein [Alcaligenaceae bacterium]